MSHLSYNIHNRYRVEILSKQHNRIAFHCGIEALDHYLKKQAGQEARKRIAVTYVLIDHESEHRIAGYYTLSSTSIVPGKLPEEIAKKLPRYNAIPATLIGRLAIDEQYQKRGLGKVLLVDALQQSFVISQRIAAFAVVVDAKDLSAKHFYERFGFISFPSNGFRLFLPMKTIAELMSKKVFNVYNTYSRAEG